MVIVVWGALILLGAIAVFLINMRLTGALGKDVSGSEIEFYIGGAAFAYTVVAGINLEGSDLTRWMLGFFIACIIAYRRHRPYRSLRTAG